jgi:protein ImuA
MFLLCSLTATERSIAMNAVLEDLRRRMARIARHSAAETPPVLAFGIDAIDARLPGGGLAAGSLHEIAGGGPDIEHGAAAALLIGGVLARADGRVLWAVERRDLFSPALDGVGLHADRVVFAETGRSASGILLVMEEGLRHRGLAAVVGELGGRLTLTASRRLQLAAETSGVTAFALRRSRRHDDPALSEPTAAVTRWRVSALPSAPPLAHAPRVPGLGRARWRLDLVRCRGGEAFSWMVEACDAQGHLALAADLADRPGAPGLAHEGGSYDRGRAAG